MKYFHHKIEIKRMIALQKSLLVGYYRIYLTIKYSIEFESYKSKLRANRRKEF